MLYTCKIRKNSARKQPVPIVEPEVIMDGNHTINDCLKATTLTLQHVFNQLKF